jgi:hypothetical protein
MRHFFIALTALVASLPAFAASPALRQQMMQPPGWVVPAVAHGGQDCNYAVGRFWPSFGRCQQTVTRAISGTGHTVDYAVDSLGNWWGFGANVPRTTNLGTKIEEARTNSIRNNTMQGAVVGTPGTLPTNWVINNNSGLTPQIVGLGTQNGINYIDIRWSGTTNNTQVQFSFDSAIAATTSQAWGASIFLAQPAGALTNVSNVTISFNEQNSGSYLRSQFSSNITSIPTSLNASSRYGYVLTTGATSTNQILPLFEFTVANASLVDVTFRFGMPGFELGTSVTTPIATTSAAVTRNADVSVETNPPVFGAAYTLAPTGTPDTPIGYTNAQVLMEPNDGTENNRIQLVRQGGGTSNARAVSTTSGTNTILTWGSGWASGSGKLAVSDAAGSQAFSWDGGTVLTGAGGLPVGVNTVFIGQSSGAASFFNGTISHTIKHPTIALPAATLQAISNLNLYN